MKLNLIAFTITLILFLSMLSGSYFGVKRFNKLAGTKYTMWQWFLSCDQIQLLHAGQLNQKDNK